MSETLNTRALNLLVTRLVEEENRRAESVVNGAAVTFDDYKHRVGFLQGLAFARKACAEVESELYGTKRG